MDHATWEQVKDIVVEALERPPAEREAFLRERCPSEAVRLHVQALLDADAEMPNAFLASGSVAALNPDELPIGSRVGPYLIVDSLGHGGMGQVFLGTDVRLHRKVALKSLISSKQDASTERGRILREARAAAQINHQNVATIHDVIEHQSRAFIVMEYVEGESLAMVLRRGRLPFDRVVAIGRQLAAALVAAHAKGVIHRDLKPANIQVTGDGSIKVLDFGVAAATGAFTTVSSAGSNEEESRGQPGTPGYMSPEQLLSRHIDERSDLFSLGLVLFEMATGARAYDSTDAMALVEAAGRPVRRADTVDKRVPRGLADVIAKALEVDPAQRFQSAAVMAASLEALQREIEAVIRRRRMIRRSASAVAAVVVLVLAAALWRSLNPDVTAAAFRPRGWALIADVDNRSGDPVLDQIIPESLSIALQQSAYVNVFTRDRLFDALRRMKQPDVPRVTDAVALDVCRREGVQVLLAGTVTKSGGAVQIVVRVIDATRNRLMFAEAVDFKRSEELFGKIDQLARLVREHLGESGAGIAQASEPLAKVTTGSIDALRTYSEGIDAMARGNVSRAAELLNAALSLDPVFAMAHVALSSVYLTLGNREQFAEHLGRAYGLRDTVTARERRVIEGNYYSAEERYDDAAASFSILAATYPDDPDAFHDLANARYAVGDISGALDAARQDLSLRPQARRAHELLVLLLDRNNEPREALAAYDQASAAVGTTSRLRWGAGLAHFGLGRLEEARTDFRALEPDAAYGNVGRLYLSRADLYEGSLQQASGQLQADIERDRATGLTSAELLRRYLLARAWLLLGRPRDARAEADKIRAASPAGVTSRDLENAAVLYATIGDIPTVMRILQRMVAVADGSPSSSTRCNVQQIRGEIALAEKRLPAALQAFRAAAAEYPGFRAHRGMARTYDASGDIDHAVQEWQRVLDARGEILRDGFPPDWVLAHLELARLFDKAGDRAASRQHAVAFLQIWRQTDTPALRAEAERLSRS